MKLRFCLPVVALFTVIISVVSCKKNNAEGRYIPSDANLAVHINLKSLSSKLPWSEIKTNLLFKDTYNTDSTWIRNLLDSPAAAGIDTDKDIVFFAQKETNGGYVAIEGSIKDEAAFKTFCSRTTDNATLTENDGINYMSRFPACIGWNNERFVYIMDAPHLQKMDDLHRRMKRDSIDITDHKSRDITATCKNIFLLEEKKSLAADDKFSALLKEQGDLHVWINTEDFYKDVRLPGMFSLVNLENFYKESITTASVNFENGSIKINAHSYSNKALAAIYEKFSGGKVNEAMLKRLPGKDVAAALAVNFKPEAFLEIVKLLKLDGIVNAASPVIGFNTNDFIKANKGDIAIGVADYKMVNDSITPEETNMPFAITKPVFNYVFAASVADTTSFNKLIFNAKRGVAAFINTDEVTLAYNYNSSYFSLSNTQSGADAFINAPANNREFISKISGSPVGGYINLQSVIKAFETLATKDSSSKIMYDASLKLWDNVLLKGGEFANGALNYTIEINMLDKNTNSLKQLNQYAALIGEMMNRQKRKELEDMRAMEDAFPPAEAIK